MTVITESDSETVGLPDRVRSPLRAAVVVVLIAGVLWLLPLALSAMGRDPAAQDLVNRLQGPSTTMPFGTDALGRDLLTRVAYGLRTTAVVAVMSVGIAAIVGGLLGTISGYFHNVWSSAILVISDGLISIPVLITGLLVAMMAGRSVVSLALGIAVGLLPRFIRLAHSLALGAANEDYVIAVKVLGARAPRILGRHIVPNIWGNYLATGSTWVASAVLFEASLTFLGLGPGPPEPTLGGLIKEGIPYLTDRPWLTLLPSAVLVTLMLLIQQAVGPRRAVEVQ